MQREYYNQDFMHSDEILWQKKKRIQKESCYQIERNKEISVLKKNQESILYFRGDASRTWCVNSISQCPASLRKRGTKMPNDDRRKRRAATFIQSCWRWLLARKELQRLQKEAKNFPLIPVNDLRMIHLEERGNDTIRSTKKQSDSDSNVKFTTVQFHRNNHNSQSDRWIELEYYMESPDMVTNIGLKFQVNRRFGRHRNTGQQRLYEFCYLLSFDLWTSYLAKILFLQGCGSCFWEFSGLARIFNGQQHSFHVCLWIPY